MMHKAIVFMMTALILVSCNKENSALNLSHTEGVAPTNLALALAATTYTMPDETQPHEGTWLQWPHAFQYGTTYRNRLDATWVAMTKALVQSEKVHIIAYNATEKTRITTLLNNAAVPSANVDFKIFQTNDVWVRDNGPIYVKDATGTMQIEDWGFNGWGNKTPFAKCNTIPAQIATAQSLGKIDLNAKMVLEGGSFEIDGQGTFLATKSSILNNNRNPNMTQAQAEVL